VNLTSSNPLFIGEMGPGSADALSNWTIVFQQLGTYALIVNASCIDTQYISRWMTNSTTVEVYDYPHAEFNYTPSTEVYVNQTVTLNATKSHAQGPGGEIVSYKWNFGDGINITTNSPIANHTYNRQLPNLFKNHRQ
jgi:PKD repeat protein